MTRYYGNNIEMLELGSVVNDGTGDTLHEAFRKVDVAIQYLFDNGLAPTSGLNLGDAGTGLFVDKLGDVFRFRKIQDVDPIRLVVNPDQSISLDFFPETPVDFNGQNIVNIGILQGNVEGILTGTVIGEGELPGSQPVNVSVLNRQVNTFDYGAMRPTFTDPIAYLMFEIGTDMGTFTDPSPVSIDAGQLGTI
jgi:hypothetical protein